MDKDIAPELLEAIQKDFYEIFENNRTIQRIEKLIKNKEATYVDLNEYAIDLGEILSQALGNHISSDTLPDGKMYYNIANRIFNPTMSNNHNIVAQKAADIQTALNHEAGLGIKGIEPKLNQDRIDGIIERVSKEDNFDNVSWILDEPMVNFTQSVVDDAIKTNAEFHAKSGLSPKIIRKAESNCCKWCSNLAGTYEYPNDVPDDVYRRHQNCHCTVEYDPGNGSKKRQNVWDKKWGSSEEDDKIEQRKQIGKEKQKTYSSQSKSIKEAEEFARNNLGVPNVSYKGVDIATANAWNEGLKDSFERFPELKKNFSFVGEAHERNRMLKPAVKQYYMDNLAQNNPSMSLAQLESYAEKSTKEYMRSVQIRKNTLAVSYSPPEPELFGLKGVSVNRDWGKNSAEFTEALQNSVRSKYHPTGCDTIRSILDHEIGHQLDDMLEINNISEVQELFDSRTKRELTDSISAYTWNNNNRNKYSEMVAEAWAEYCNNPQPREIAKTIGETIEAEYTKKFGVK